MSDTTTSLIENEATAWVARVESSEWSDGDEAELQRWLAQSSRHKGAFLRAQATWLMLDRTRIGAKAPFSSFSDKAARTVARWSASTEFVLNRRMILSAGGSAIAASLVGGWLLRPSGVLRTSPGEIRRTPLADGSVAALNTGSELEIAFSSTERRIRLRQGEAWFSVSKDPDKPFIVDAGDVQVRAVGTAFSVKRGTRGIDILVTEGRVSVSAGPNGIANEAMRAGDHGFFSYRAASLTIEHSPSVERTLAWREGRLELSNDRLADAIEDLNRYNARKIMIADPALADRKLDGLFKIDDPEAFAKAVEVTLSTPVDMSGTEIIIGEKPH